MNEYREGDQIEYQSETFTLTREPFRQIDKNGDHFYQSYAEDVFGAEYVVTWDVEYDTDYEEFVDWDTFTIKIL